MDLATTLPDSVALAREKATQMGQSLGNLVGGEASISDVLKQKITEAYSQNADIVAPLDVATQTYFQAPSVAREKYQNIFNPFAREKLVAQYQGNAALPMLSLSNIYGNRVGRIEDTLGAGIRGYEALVDTAKANYQAAKDEYSNRVNEYSLLNDLAQKAEQMKLAREEFEYSKTKPRVGTEAERLAPVRQNVLNAARKGATLNDLTANYGSQLPISDIVELYTSVSPYGTPVEDWAKKMLGISNTQSLY